MAALDHPSRHASLLRAGETTLVIVDVQEAFRPVIDGFDVVARNCSILAAGFEILGRPIIVSEQYPKGLGSTVDEIAEALPEGTPIIEKMRFSACGVDAFDAELAESGSKTVVVCGVETHVCVNQTVLDLLSRGYAVHVASDAVSSRAPANKEAGLRKMAAHGAEVSSAETVLFEMLEVAGGDAFKAISKLVR
jgi:nicotinamidase-related amidase